MVGILKKQKTKYQKLSQEDWNNRKAKSIKTNLERYGVEWNSQSPEMFKKQVKYKQYILPSGKIVNLQGYECIVLDDLLNIYEEADILISCAETPTINKYKHNKKIKNYYPDIYIKSINTIIEVKSQYTFDLHKEINLLKQQAVIDNGYNFEFRIIKASKNYENKLHNIKLIGKEINACI